MGERDQNHVQSSDGPHVSVGLGGQRDMKESGGPKQVFQRRGGGKYAGLLHKGHQHLLLLDHLAHSEIDSLNHSI